MLRLMTGLFPSALRTKGRRWKHWLEDICREIDFDCHPWIRREKLERLRLMTKMEDIYHFASQEFSISQIQNEILPLLQFLAERHPRVVGEIGTYMSGNSFLFSQILPDLSLQILVDLKIKNRSKLQFYAPRDLSLACVNGSSCVASTRHQVARALRDESFDFLFIDGDHEYAGVRQDLLQYASWMRPGGVVAFHDIIPDHFVRFGRPGPFYAGEVYLLWRQLKKRFRCWEFIGDPDQNGAGIGVMEFDADTSAKLSEISQLEKNDN